MGVDPTNVRLFYGQLELVEKSKGGSAFLLHYLMNELAIELDLERPEMRLDLLEVLDFRLFASPIFIRPFGSALLLGETGQVIHELVPAQDFSEEVPIGEVCLEGRDLLCGVKFAWARTLESAMSR